jgi:hypothetical protein
MRMGQIGMAGGSGQQVVLETAGRSPIIYAELAGRACHDPARPQAITINKP